MARLMRLIGSSPGRYLTLTGARIKAAKLSSTRQSEISLCSQSACIADGTPPTCSATLRMEEQWMRSQFGETYATYARQTSALVPYLL